MRDKIAFTVRLLALTVAFCAVGRVWAYTETVNGIRWTYTVVNGEASIGSHAIPTSTAGAITIPSTLGGYRVTSIESSAFSWCSRLTSVTIPDSVTRIESNAFHNCSGLTSVTIPDSVTSIGSFAFYNCSGLTSVSIGDSVTSIGYKAFYECRNLTSVHISNMASWCGISFDDDLANPFVYAHNLYINGELVTCIEIPSGLTSIGSYAFYGCSGLTSVTMPDSVTSIGSYAFEHCSGLTSVTIPDSVTSIRDLAFSGCSGLTSVTIPDSVTNIGYSAFYDCSGLTSLTIPDSVTSIGNSAFSRCSGLTSLTIGGGVTSIGNSVFTGCSGLTSVTIPDSVTSIGDEAFRGCSGLTSVTIPDSVTSIGNRVFDGCNNLCYDTETIPCVKLVDGWVVGTTGLLLGDLDLTGVRGICNGVFRGCSGLTSVTLGDGVANIGSYAFSGCNGLTSLTIGNSVTSIGSSAFSGCRGLTSVTIPDSVTSIGSSAFYGCYGLTSVTIGISVTNIGSQAFYGCSVATVRINASDIASLCTNVISDTLSGDKLLFMDGTEITELLIPDSVTSIGNRAFYNCNGLTSVTIGNSVTNIGSQAFEGCSGLTSVTIPNSVTSIGSSAFSGCSGLTSVTIPDGVTSIGSSAFYNCSGLASVTIPDSVTSIGDNAFSGCSNLLLDTTTITNVKLLDGWVVGHSDALSGDLDLNGVKGVCAAAFSGCNGLTSVTIPDSVTSIGSSAFYGCSGLTSVSIGDSVTSIGNNAFCNCSGLTSVTIPDSVTSIGDWAFSSCSGLTNVTLGDSVTSIGSQAFYGCRGLTSVTIPDSVTSIGDNAFASCYGLTNVTIGNSVTNIGSYAFSGCSGLTNVTIPDSVTSIGSHAFFGCNGLTSVTMPNSVTSIGSSAFGYCSGLTNVTIPDSVTSIGSYAFSGCSGLTNVTIPDSVTSIGSQAFSGCTGLTSVTIPDSVTSIWDYAFSNCSGLTSVMIGGGVTSIGWYAFSGCSGLTNVTIPDSVTSIGSYAFSSCSGLTSVTIGAGVTSIGSYAFEGCSGLTSVTIPDSVTSIGSSAFYNCSGLTSVTMLGDSPEISDSVFDVHCVVYIPRQARGYRIDANSSWQGLTVKYYKRSPQYIVDREGVLTKVNLYDSTECVIPDNVTNIGNAAFSGCNGLTSVTIPDSVTSIGDCAFSNCRELTSVTIPDSVTSIGEYAFADCYALTSVTIGNSVTNIGHGAFNSCYGLTSVHISDMASWCGISSADDYANPLVYAHNLYLNGELVTCIEIPSGVTSVGSYAFSGCSGLISVTIPDSVTSIGRCAFSGCNGLTSVNISDMDSWCGILFSDYYANPLVYAHDLYLNGELVTNIEIPSDVTCIGDYAFEHCSGLTSVSIPDSVTNIGSYAFSDCSGLTSVTIPDSVTSIGDHAFYGCYGLTNVTIGNSVTNIGSQAFAYCRRLTSVTIPDSVTSIEYAAFENCSGLTSVTIPDSVTSIGSSAFYNCSGLTSVTIPDSVTSIGNRAFYACNVANVRINVSDIASFCTNVISGALSGDKLLFMDGTEITELVIPQGLTSIGSSAFRGCSGLTSVTMPDSVTSIGSSAFYNCSGLTSVTIPDSVTSIGDSAFLGCIRLTSVTIPDSVTSIGNSAFANCGSLERMILPFVGAQRGNSGTNKALFGYIFGSYSFAGGIQTKQAYGSYSYSYSTCYVPAALKEVVITDETTLGYGAISNCGGLTNVIISASVTNIADRAFYGCSSLTNIEIPDSVVSIGPYAFYGCRCTDGNEFVIVDNVLYGYVGLGGDVTIPDGIADIAPTAFAGCTGITSVTIPCSVTNIGYSAFSGCSGLTSVTIPDSVTSIGDNAFYGCSGLTSLTIPDSVTSIGYDAFSGCSALEELPLPTEIMEVIEAGCGVTCDALRTDEDLQITLHFEDSYASGKEVFLPERETVFTVEFYPKDAAGDIVSTNFTLATAVGYGQYVPIVLTGVDFGAYSGYGVSASNSYYRWSYDAGRQDFPAAMAVVGEFQEGATVYATAPTGLIRINYGNDSISSIGRPGTLELCMTPPRYDSSNGRSVYNFTTNIIVSGMAGVIYARVPQWQEVCNFDDPYYYYGYDYYYYDFYNYWNYYAWNDSTLQDRLPHTYPLFYYHSWLDDDGYWQSVEMTAGSGSYYYYYNYGNGLVVPAQYETKKLTLKARDYDLRFGWECRDYDSSNYDYSFSIMLEDYADVTACCENGLDYCEDVYDSYGNYNLAGKCVALPSDCFGNTPYACIKDGYYISRIEVEDDSSRYVEYGEFGEVLSASGSLYGATSLLFYTSPRTYAIYFEDERGASNPNRATYTVGDYYSFQSLGSVEGWDFAGWDMRGVCYQTGDIVVTAQWTRHHNTVKFDLGASGVRTGGGELEQTIEWGSAVAAPEVEAARGWRFVGWDADLSSITSDLTIKALYAELCIGSVEIAGGAPFVYDGTAQCPDLIVKDKSFGEVLTQGVDYDVTYSDNVNSGTVTVTVTGRGNYTGTGVKTFEILNADFGLVADGESGGASGESGTIAGYEGVYDGEGHGLAIDVSAIGDVGVKYALSEEGPYVDSLLLTNVCDQTVWVELSALNYNSFTGFAQVVISPKSIEGCRVDVESPVAYDGHSMQAAVLVVDEDLGTTLVYGVDYELEYSENEVVGTAGVKVVGIGNYKDEVERAFEVVKGTIRINDESTWQWIGAEGFAFDGTNKTVAFASDGAVPDEVVDVEITGVTNAVHAGTYTAYANGTMTGFKTDDFYNYCYTTVLDNVSCTWQIQPRSCDNCDASLSPGVMFRTGGGLEPEITVVDGGLGTTLARGVDYELNFRNNVNIGTAEVEVEFMGDYFGSKTLNYHVVDIVENLPKVRITPQSGIYEGRTGITLNYDGVEGVDCVVRYTLDGSEPTAESPVYSGKFTTNITGEMWLKVAAFSGKVRISEVSVSHIYPTIASIILEDGSDPVGFTTEKPLQWVLDDAVSGLDGRSVMRSSADVADNGESVLSATFNGKGILMFKWKTSCEEDEPGYYYFDHAVCVADGEEVAWLDGVTGWVDVSLTFEDEGEHTVVWKYVKDDADDGEYPGEDCAWLGKVSWTSSSAITLTFDAGDGSVEEADRMMRLNDPVASLPVPTWAHHDFAGWWTAEGVQVEAGARLYEDTALYAHWTLSRYAVSFDPNGGEVEAEDRQIEYGAEIGELPTPKWEGREFLGWFTLADGGDAVFAETEVLDAVALFAHWRKFTFTVSFDPNGGTPSHGERTVEYGDEIGSLPEVSWVGREFLGWFVCETDVQAFADTVVTADVSLEARWRKLKYAVSFDPCGGSVDSEGFSIEYENAVGELPVPTWEGREFLGWFTAAVGGEQVDAALQVTDAVSLFAHWRKYTFTVSFNANGGEVTADDRVVEYGDAIGELPVPEYEHMEFLGWYTPAGVLVAGDTAVTEDMPLRAEWRYAFSFDGDGEWNDLGGGVWQSGETPNSATNSVGMEVEGEGTIAFCWKVSCEDPHVFRDVEYRLDYLAFAIDGEEKRYIYGTTDWASVSFAVVGLGSHVFEWLYVKDSVEAAGYDCGWIRDVEWTPRSGDAVEPEVEGDEGANITGDSEKGYTVIPSDSNKDVVVTIPEGVEPKKVTVEVAATVETVTANGAKVKVMKGGYDIAAHLDLEAVTQGGVINLAAAKVKEDVVKEALDTAKGATVSLGNTESPTLTTAATKPGLTYTLQEGTTLEEMLSCADGDSKLGDGTAWTPKITVKGGTSGFYTIKVEK